MQLTSVRVCVCVCVRVCVCMGEAVLAAVQTVKLLLPPPETPQHLDSSESPFKPSVFGKKCN